MLEDMRGEHHEGGCARTDPRQVSSGGVQVVIGAVLVDAYASPMV